MAQPRFESWIDQQIRTATERGEFDNLSGAGKPIDLGRSDDPDWWVRRKLADEQIDMSSLLPTPVAVRREKEAIDQTLARVRTESDARELIVDLNDRIKRANLERTKGVPPIITGLLDVEQTLARWRAGRAGGAA